MKVLSAQQYAGFSDGSYTDYKDPRDRADAVRQTLDEWDIDPSWEVVPHIAFTNEHFTTFTDGKHVVISTRGTDVTNGQDLLADVDIATDSNLTGRLKERVTLIKSLIGVVTGKTGHMPDGHEFQLSDITITGHSLGGAIASDVALQSGTKAVVFNMGSSPVKWLKSENNPKRDYDNVLHFTTNRVTDNVGDVASSGAYFAKDSIGTGIRTISYKLPESKRKVLNPFTGNHGINVFRRDTTDEQSAMQGHDGLYDTAVDELLQHYTSESNNGSSERSYTNPDIEEYGDDIVGQVRNAVSKVRKTAASIKKAAKAAADKKREDGSTNWGSVARWLGMILGGAALVVAAAATGGAALLAPISAYSGAIAASGVGLTTAGIVTDDAMNFGHKTTTELILDGVSIAALGAGEAISAARAAKAAVAGGRALGEAAEGGIEMAEIGERVADQSLGDIANNPYSMGFGNAASSTSFRQAFIQGVGRNKDVLMLDAFGKIPAEISTVAGDKADDERKQDIDAANLPPPAKRRRPNASPSDAPGSHMDPSEMLVFTGGADHHHSMGVDDVDDVPTSQLRFDHKGLMSGRGVDITTQIPMVSAAKGNFLRAMAQRSAMY